MIRQLFAERAVAGDPDAQRIFLGSYHLLRERATGVIYRSDRPAVEGFDLIHDAHDADGFLSPQWWGQPRIESR